MEYISTWSNKTSLYKFLRSDVHYFVPLKVETRDYITMPEIILFSAGFGEIASPTVSIDVAGNDVTTHIFVSDVSGIPSLTDPSWSDQPITQFQF
jgi:hypothetical protein